MHASPPPKGLIHACDLRASRGDGPFGSIAARELVEVATAPLIVHAIGRLGAAGIDAVGVVVDAGAAEAIRAVVDEAPRPCPRITYLESDGRCSVAEALLLARDFAEGAPVVLHASDALLLEDLSVLLEAFFTNALDAMVVRPLDPHAPGWRSQPHRGGAAERSWGDGSRSAEPLHLLSPRFLETLARGNDLLADDALGDALACLAEHGAGVETRWIAASVLREPLPQALLHANRRLLDELTKAPGGSDPVPDEPSVDLQGAVILHEDAVVESSTIRGPAIIAAGARISDAYVGPYTSVGRDVTLSAVEIENSIVMSGSTVRDFGTRVEASVIGRRCRIERDFRLPRAVRLELGDAGRLVVS